MSIQAIDIDQLAKDELLDELTSFLYDAYMHQKEAKEAIITEVGEGQNAENENQPNKWLFNNSSWRIFGVPQACPRYAS